MHGRDQGAWQERVATYVNRRRRVDVLKRSQGLCGRAPVCVTTAIAVNESVSGGVPKPIRRDPTNGAVLGETSVLLFLGEDSLGVHADARASDHCPALTHYRDTSDLFLQERDAARREGRSVILSAVGSAPHVVGRW